MALLDLVALATVCDVMPLTGLNRALVTQGLKVMARRGRPGIAALLEVAQVRDRPTAATLRLRARPAHQRGRPDQRVRSRPAAAAVRGHDRGARRWPATLDAVNRQRQDWSRRRCWRPRCRRRRRRSRPAMRRCWWRGAEWHPGVVGIVAGRIKERFNRPACVAGMADGMAKGSGRSVPGLDLGAAVIAARQAGLLMTGGGHAMAAGFSLPEAQVAAFHAFLDERLAAASLLPSAADLLVEGTLAVPGCTTELAQHLARLAPFGTGNEEPVLILPRARVVRADRVGKEAATIRAFVEGEGGGRAAEGGDVPRAEGALAERAAGARRRAAAPGRASARGGMERQSGRGLRRARRGRGVGTAIEQPKYRSGTVSLAAIQIAC